MSADPKRALVTGGAGFIGSHLTERLLAEGYEVDVIDDLSVGTLGNLAEARSARGAFRFHQLDITSEGLLSLLQRRRPQIIFHLAARSFPGASFARPLDDARTNIIGSLCLLEAARAASVERVVYASSALSLYGETDCEGLPISESTPFRPTSPFGVSKKAVVDYLSFYRANHGIEFVVLMLSSVYGPRQSDGGEGSVVGTFCSLVGRGKKATISGDGEQSRDFLFVDDAVDAFARAAKKGSGLVVNVGSGQATSVKALFAEIADLTGTANSPRHGPAIKGEVRHFALDCRRAALHLGWKPFTTLRDGLAKTIDFARAHPSKP